MSDEQIVALAREVFGMGGDYPLLTVERVLEFAEKLRQADRATLIVTES